MIEMDDFTMFNQTVKSCSGSLQIFGFPRLSQ